ncbi:uncharacterized protein LOC120635598 [Pararge aegeria]|uniref:Jg16947 protein n=1 Tax=Pararge aegeria aegeria TaxID=348720 RepID=A0A8S4SAM3_9NEOP|nr:uncharacterized protein LOC120635598 [Pararge aegeria]CAH2264491.1 jg16947 [Pararge aegeria aegeria]
MKPKIENSENKDDTVTGDVIGDTAYSERFVLKLLLKFANLDTLKDEIQEKSFEEDLCTLWDMTAERDVVLFLQKHDVLNLLSFAWPVIESPRIVEVLIGIIGNMCCQREAAESLLKMNSFLTMLLEYAKSEDSLTIIQLLRLINSSLFLSDDNISIWIDMFINVGYSNALYFILKNSSNKELLLTGLENFNTICSYCNTGRNRTKFFGHFVGSEAIVSLVAAFTEITVKQKDCCDRDQLERVLIISLQITLNLVGFDKSYEVLSDNKPDVGIIIAIVFSYYENKFVNQKEIDMDLIDIIDSAYTIVRELQIGELCDYEQYCLQSYSMWKTLSSIATFDQNGGSSFENDDKEELQEFSKKMKTSLSILIFNYLENCSDDNLLKALDLIDSNYEDMLSLVNDKLLVKAVSDRASNYRTRLKETENC